MNGSTPELELCMIENLNLRMETNKHKVWKNPQLSEIYT